MNKKKSLIQFPNFDNVHFRKLTLIDSDPVCNFLAINYYPDESISKILGTSPKFQQDCDKNVKLILNKNLSLGVFQPESDEIFGVLLINSIHQGEPIEGGESNEWKIKDQFLNHLTEDDNLFELYHVKNYAQFSMVCIKKDLRGQKLARELFVRGLEFLKSTNFNLIKCFATGPYTRTILSKLGFKELARRYYREMRNLEGKQLSPNATGKEFVAFVVHQM